MKNILTVLTMLFFLQMIKAQPTPKEAIKIVITSFFAAMKKGDTALLRNTFAEGAIMQTIAINNDGAVRVKTDAIADFIRSVGKAEPGSLDERIQIDAIHIDGALAAVWTPYNFYYKGKLLHSGANSFQLVKIGNEWKVQYIIDTRRKR